MRTVFLATAGVLLTALVARAEDAKTPNVVGTWVPTSGMIEGKALEEEFLASTKLILTSGKYTTIVSNAKENGSYSMDFSKKPVTCDIKAEDGPNAGKTILALVEVSGDTMKIAYNLGSGMRPKDFTSTAENKAVLMVYKREASKEPGKPAPKPKDK